MSVSKLINSVTGLPTLQMNAIVNYYTIMEETGVFPRLEDRLELQFKMGTHWTNKIKQWYFRWNFKKHGGFNKSLARGLLNEIEKLTKALEVATLEMKAMDAKIETESVVSSIAESEYNPNLSSIASVSTVSTTSTALVKWNWALSADGMGPGLKNGECYGIKTLSSIKGYKTIEMGPRGGVKRCDSMGSYLPKATVIYKFDVYSHEIGSLTITNYKNLFEYLK